MASRPIEHAGQAQCRCRLVQGQPSSQGSCFGEGKSPSVDATTDVERRARLVFDDILGAATPNMTTVIRLKLAFRARWLGNTDGRKEVIGKIQV